MSGYPPPGGYPPQGSHYSSAGPGSFPSPQPGYGSPQHPGSFHGSPAPMGSFQGSPAPMGSFHGSPAPMGSFHGSPAPMGSFHGSSSSLGSFQPPPINPATLEQLRQFWMTADSDHSGSISIPELATLPFPGNGPFAGKQIGPMAANMLINTWDRSRTGQLNWETFCALFQWLEVMQMHFYNADRDRGGTLDLGEVPSALMACGYNLPVHELSTIVQKHSTGGHLNFIQFMALVLDLQSRATNMPAVVPVAGIAAHGGSSNSGGSSSGKKSWRGKMKQKQKGSKKQDGKKKGDKKQGGNGGSVAGEIAAGVGAALVEGAIEGCLSQ